jgi:hypothetical protein
MNKLTAVISLSGMLLLGMIYSGTVLAKDAEDMMTIETAGTILPENDSVISSAAIKVLRHIAQARFHIHEKDPSRAQSELKQARTLIAIIRTRVPTEKVKDRIWIAHKHLSYESTEDVMQDLVPIYDSLDEIEDVVPVEKTREHINKAKKHLKEGAKKSAGEELKLADEALRYNEIDQPLGNTERHVINAQALLKKKELQKADAALKSAEKGVEFISLMSYTPVIQARNSLRHASKNFAAGELAAAKKDLQEAKISLEKVINSGDVKTRAEAEKLRNDVETVEGKVDKGEKETDQEIKTLYERAKDLTLSAVDLFQAGGNQAGEGIGKAMEK